MSASTQSEIDEILPRIGNALATGDASKAIRAMQQLIASSSLRAEISSILHVDQRLERVAGAGQVHPNSFVKYVIADTELAKLVLHVWAQPEDVDKVETHNHRWNFVSTVLAGSLRASTLKEGGTGAPVTEYEYHSPSNGGRFELRLVGPRRLEVLDASEITAGTTYFQPYREIHNAHVKEKPTVTLIVQGPVLQNATRVFMREGQTDARSDIARVVVRPTIGQTQTDLLELSNLLAEGRHEC